MQLFSSSLSAFAFAVLWPVALLAIAVFCAWLERRTLLPPQAPGARRRASARSAPQGRVPVAVASSAAAPPAPATTAPAAAVTPSAEGPSATAPAQPVEPRHVEPRSAEPRSAEPRSAEPQPNARPASPRPKYSASSAPVPPLPPPPPDAQSFKEPGEVLGKYPPLGGPRVQRVPEAAPGETAEPPDEQPRP
jgi:hypothetical protein